MRHAFLAVPRASSAAGLVVLTLLFAVANGCGSGSPKDGRFPPRPLGCDVQVYPEAPALAIDNIGTVTAICGEDVKDDACLRTLKDEACKLGGDVVWGVSDEPSMSIGKKKLAGRAAHRRGGAGVAPPGAPTRPSGGEATPRP